MTEYNYKKTDAFTSSKSLGNPAACVFLECSQRLTEDEMLNIAKQHKGFVSEVVYCSVLNDSEINLTYYSSECEVDFCGHGTIACIYSLIKSSKNMLDKKELTIHTNKKGSLTVYNYINEQDAIYITAPTPMHIGTNLSIIEIADNLQIESESILSSYPIDIINAGLKTLIVPIGSIETEINIYPDEKKLKLFCEQNDIDIILTFSKEVNSSENIAHTRVFAPKFGYLEDPATGSGNSAFGYYMLKNDMWNGESISIEQGGAGIEFNIIKLFTKNNAVLFGGRATDRIVGKYYL